MDVKDIFSILSMRLISITNKILPGCQIKHFIVSTIHAIWMIIFSLIWLTHINTFDGFEFMSEFMEYREWICHSVFKIKPDAEITEKYLLINTSNNNQVIPLDNNNLTNTVITNRATLINALNVLDSNSIKFKYIICDIFFDEHDKVNDSLLQNVISRLNIKKKIIIPYYIQNEPIFHFNYPIISSKNGLSQYKNSFLKRQFLKFSFIVKDTLKQLPLLAYETISGRIMKKKCFIGVPYFTMDGKWCLNTIIPEFRYTPYDIIPDETYYDLGIFSRDFIGDNQVVIIGDFEGSRDRHNSIVSYVTGPLILVNAMESLSHGDNVINISYLLMLFIFFIIISYHFLYKKRIKEFNRDIKKINGLFNLFMKKIDYILILLLTIVSMILFHHYINLFALLSYFVLLEIIINWNGNKNNSSQ